MTGAGSSGENADESVVEEAILAFDAGNHAWGRYRHFVLPVADAARGAGTAAVREALQEAAICVPDAGAGEIGPFLSALRGTADALTQYRATLPAGVSFAEIDEAAGDIDEALALLEGRLPKM